MTETVMGEPSPTWQSFEDMRRFLRDHLGHTLPDDQVAQLQKIKSKFRERQSRLVAMLLGEELNKERYLRDFTAIAEEYMRETRAIMGDEDFSIIFGKAGYEPGALIDRDIFFTRN